MIHVIGRPLRTGRHARRGTRRGGQGHPGPRARWGEDREEKHQFSSGPQAWGAGSPPPKRGGDSGWQGPRGRGCGAAPQGSGSWASLQPPSRQNGVSVDPADGAGTETTGDRSVCSSSGTAREVAEGLVAPPKTPPRRPWHPRAVAGEAPLGAVGGLHPAPPGRPLPRVASPRVPR